MKMTEEQFEALTAWVAAKIADQTYRNAPDDYDGGLHESIRESEAHSHLRRLLVEDEEPEDEVSEGERVLRDAAANMVDRANELAAERSAAAQPACIGCGAEMPKGWPEAGRLHCERCREVCE